MIYAAEPAQKRNFQAKQQGKAVKHRRKNKHIIADAYQPCDMLEFYVEHFAELRLDRSFGRLLRYSVRQVVPGQG